VIPQAFITEWRRQAPWPSDVQVEQDLLLCRTLVMLFRDPLIYQHLAFRGGTALHKLFLQPSRRYSEDIDLVQRESGPIGPVFDAMHGVLDGWLGEPRRDQAQGTTTLIYRVQSEGPPVVNMRLKIEINTREHFSVRGLHPREFSIATRWFAGTCHIPTFTLDELLATKLRALYQRRKGRDLFDLWLGLTDGKADAGSVEDIFQHYMRAEGHHVSQAVFRENVVAKLRHPGFLSDVPPLLVPGTPFDGPVAFELIDRDLISRMA